MYTYVKNQYLLGRFSEADLLTLVNRGIITDQERQTIISGE